MTGGTFGLTMGTKQLIVGRAIMVKNGPFPAMGRMTGPAFRTKTTLMTLFAIIIFFVTADTFARCILERFLFVTALTFGQTMLTDQWKIGLTMIIASLFPVLLGVTVLAFFAQLALMIIIFLVTGITGRWRITIFLA